MNRFKGGIIVFFTTAAIYWLIASQNQDKKGLVTYTDGEVKHRTTQEEIWQDAPVNTEIISGDKVRTYRQSRAELDLAEMDIIRLAPRTIVDVVKLYEETKDSKLQTSLNLEEGELWASVHKVESDTKFDISAPIAAAAITGTVLRMKVGDDTTTQLKVYEGEVEIRKKETALVQPVPMQSLKPTEVPGPTEVQGPHEVTADEWVKIVKAMQQITISKKGEIISWSGFSPDDEEEKTDWVQWNQNLDRLRQLRLENMKKRLNR